MSREFELSKQQDFEARRHEFDHRFTRCHFDSRFARFRKKLRLEKLIRKELELEILEEI